MKKFLIEVPHGEDKQSCSYAIKVFLQTGSHFLTNAEWGCMDGDHKAWILIETDNKEEAMAIVPPVFRSTAKVVQLTQFSKDDILNPDKYHA